MAATAPAYSSAEELIHALTAGLGIVACVVAIPWLAWVSAGDAPRMVAALVFGCSALAMFITSVIYHSARQPDRKLVLRKFDHAAIYLLIAGTYTPVTLVAMRDAWGWVLFASVWALAAFGIIAKTAVGFPVSAAFHLPVPRHGLAGRRRIQAHRGFAERRRARLDPRGRPGLHRRRAVLHLEITPLYARGVAPVRARRRGLPLCRGAQPGDDVPPAESYFLRRGGARFFAGFFHGLFRGLLRGLPGGPLRGFFRGTFPAGCSGLRRPWPFSLPSILRWALP